MSDAAREARALAAAELARAGVEWLLSDGPSDDDDYSLYHGRAGILLALHEAGDVCGGPALDDAIQSGLDRLTDDVGRADDCSLYSG